MDLIGLQTLLDEVAGARVLVIGDIMLDCFIDGAVSRVSAEAPVPVLAHRSEAVMLGAAGNVARNLAALGGVATLIGLIGDDDEGREVHALISEGVRAELIIDPGRRTTTKTRFVSSGQQLLRLDREDVAPAEGAVEARLTDAVKAAAGEARAILLSDYGKGAVTAGVAAAALAAAKARGIPLIVDSKARHFALYGEADVIKPNAAELAFATGLPTATDIEVEVALAEALAHSPCGAILVTRSAKGMSLAVRGQPVRHFRRPAPEVFDTAGAGDTALAALGLALAAGAKLADATRLALLASSVAVEKAGVAVVSPAELLEAELAAHRQPSEAKIVTHEGLLKAVRRWRGRGLRIGFTNGCFDILHPGHVAYLAQARSWCDRLVVAVNSDASVCRAKGPGRPINDLEGRALVLAGLACVDLITAFEEDTPAALIAALRPDVLVKGGDYEPETVVGADQVRSWGGEVKIADFVVGHSTTATLARTARG
ncbi:MAG TPA: D-glycero-beta-D-manno-heptose 1-phosphate adenylyltransferase [Caulobacteraceae bacterium]